MNRKDDWHPWEGCRFIYHDVPWEPWQNFPEDPESGQLVVGNGMVVFVTGVYHDWNKVPGLTILSVYVSDTQQYTHVTPADLGLGQEPEEL